MLLYRRSAFQGALVATIPKASDAQFDLVLKKSPPSARLRSATRPSRKKAETSASRRLQSASLSRVVLADESSWLSKLPIPNPLAQLDERPGNEAPLQKEDEGWFCLSLEGPQSCSFRLVSLSPKDIPDCQSLLDLVGFDTCSGVWEDIFSLDQYDVLGVLDYSGPQGRRLVGVVTAVFYSPSGGTDQCSLDDRNPFGWIGNLVVDPSYRSRGLARVLLAAAVRHLQRLRRCRAVLLDASRMGKPVYDKLGFRDVALVHRMSLQPKQLHRLAQAEGWSVRSTVSEGVSQSCEKQLEHGQWSARLKVLAEDVQCLLGERNLRTVLGEDEEVFGADRGVILRRWQERWPQCSLWLPSASESDVDSSVEVAVNSKGSALAVVSDDAGKTGRSAPRGNKTEPHLTGAIAYGLGHARQKCDYIGPIVAEDSAAAAAVLTAALKQIWLSHTEDPELEERPVVLHVLEPSCSSGPQVAEEAEEEGKSALAKAAGLIEQWAAELSALTSTEIAMESTRHENSGRGALDRLDKKEERKHRSEGTGKGSYKEWSSWLRSLGFEFEETTTRQVLGGSTCPGDLRRVYAIASLDLG